LLERIPFETYCSRTALLIGNYRLPYVSPVEDGLYRPSPGLSLARMSSDSHTYEQLYRETIPSVVSVYTNPTDNRRRPPRGAGSGFVYDAAHIVTNQHVVAGSRTVEARFSQNDWRTGRVTGTDAYTDLAVIRIDNLPDYAEPLPVASENPTPGQAVAALGNPMGLDGTITTGIVSGINRSMRTTRNFTIPDTVQTDAPINPGNSGARSSRSTARLWVSIAPVLVTTSALRFPLSLRRA
jgi:S1-C subfamily serine protease